MSDAGPTDLLPLLKEVSRSFYLTLRVLPAQVRFQIGLAYLLARTTDTIADTELVPPARRLEALQRLREAVLVSDTPALDFGELARCQASPAERVLLERWEATRSLLARLSPDDLALVRRVLDVITGGQELDLRRFSGDRAGGPAALRDGAELDDYTYRVAGCVGEFWTRICRAHLFPGASLDDHRLLEEGVRFGKGLQLVNILRDLPADLKQGRCYLPLDDLTRAGLAPADLLSPANEPRLRPVYNEWLARAAAHLAAGWNYTNTLPWTCVRVRLACAWPVLIGLDTVRLLEKTPVLDPARRVKITRGRVKGILWRSVLYYPLPGVWRGLGQGRGV